MKAAEYESLNMQESRSLSPFNFLLRSPAKVSSWLTVPRLQGHETVVVFYGVECAEILPQPSTFIFISICRVLVLFLVIYVGVKVHESTSILMGQV